MGNPQRRHRLVILSGPSCAGKSPLKRALKKELSHLGQKLRSPILLNSRAPRPNEEDGADYHFRSREEIEKLRKNDGYFVMQARADLQAVDMGELSRLLDEGDVLYEGQVGIALALKRAPRFHHAEVLDVFLSPLSLAEIRALREASPSLAEVVADLTRRRLMRRLMKQRPFATLPELEDVETRAQAAYHSLLRAHEFTYVLPNHDGEDRDHWTAFPTPLGDARRSIFALAALLRRERHEVVETWPESLDQLDAGSD